MSPNPAKPRPVSTAGNEKAEKAVFWENSTWFMTWPCTELCPIVGNALPTDPNGDMSAVSKSKAFATALLKAVFDANCVIVGKPNEIGDSVAYVTGILASANKSSIINVSLNVSLSIYYPPLIKNTASVD
jgi:hypothetical protein